MEGRKPSLTLRRHSTSPGATGRSIIASVSGGRTINRKQITPSQVSFKSNPYVGWFRHSPSTAPRFSIPKTSAWCAVPNSLVDCKNSPHVGWFRHAPPSRLEWQQPQQSLVLSPEEQDLLWKLLQELRPSLDASHNVHGKRWMVSGNLPGGGRKYKEGSRNCRSKDARFQNLRESSAEGTMSTVDALSRLATWFLFPVAHDAESSGYRNDHPRKRNMEDTILSHLSPYLPSFLEEPPRDVPQDVYAKYGARVDSEGECEDDDSSSDSDSSVSSLEDAPRSSNTSNKMTHARDLSSSVSSLAEAYYAHQTTTKEFGTASSRLTPSLSDTGPVSPHRLDYVITQMDIARMTRNASRHLDVQSILSLPVITYKKGIQATAAKAKMDQAGWSWTIVEESEGEQATSSTPESDVDFCVICLEHFVNGDRLRVLPCDHSFHVGCIDRWLSGSQSFEECYTSGCPTCKKRPTMDSRNICKPRAQSFCGTTNNVREGKNRSASLDGSVPSWAFAQIGSALVAQQDQGISICSGASTSE